MLGSNFDGNSRLRAYVRGAARWGTVCCLFSMVVFIAGCPPPSGCSDDAGCDDSNACTDDACVDGTCESTNNTAACDDGDACTDGNTCADGSCGAGDAVEGCCNSDDDCGENEACADNACTSTCTEDADCADDGNACTGAVCTDGACAVVNNTDACDDLDACTEDDACADGVCTGAATQAATDCVDNEVFCDGTEACDPTTGTCESSGDPCPADQTCNEADDTCGTPVEWIYFSDPGSDSIRRVRPDGTDLSVIVPDQEASLGIAIDQRAGPTGGPIYSLYWTDLNADAVRRSDLEGLSPVQTLVLDTSLFNSPMGLALDPPSSMYWLANNTSQTPNQQAIFRASLSGDQPEVIVNGLGGTPIGIAIDRIENRLFLTNQGDLGGTDGSLWRVDLNDMSIAPVVVTGITLRDPRGIAVDAEGGRIYWVDTLAAAGVYSANTDGTDAGLICADAGTLNGVALDLSVRRIYWTNQFDETIKVGNMDGPCNASVVIGGLSNPYAIALFPSGD